MNRACTGVQLSRVSARIARQAIARPNGRLNADLLADRSTELSDFWIANRKAVPIPGEPLAYLGQRLVTGILRGIDRWEERQLDQAKA